MSKLQIKKINIGLIIVFLASASYFMWSVTLPFNTGPDEYMRYQIPQFIYEHGSLPHGGDPTIRNEIWGFSYGFTPILSYIISALFMKIMSIFSQNDFALLIAARFTSVLWSAGTVLMCCKIGKKLFSKRLQYLLAIFVGFLPQFIFISSYVNNDSMAVFSTSLIIYFWIVGLESKWNFRSCIGLAVGISLCALSYYNAYGYILCSILLFIFSFVYQYRQSKSGWLICNKLIKKGVLISIIVFALISWWFIRSYIIYNGDIIGLATQSKYAQMYAIDEYKPSNRITPQSQGFSILYMLLSMGWLKSSWKSFIGVFDYMSLPIYNWMYFIFNLLIILGVVGLAVKLVCKLTSRNCFNKLNVFFYFSMFLSSIITIFLSIYYSYTEGFQAQGRYCMPILISLMIFIIMGSEYLIKNINRIIIDKIIYYLSIGYILMSILIYTSIIIPTYYSAVLG